MATPLSPLSWIAIILIRVYQYTISPLIGPRCRFAPSCSAYAVTAIETHGFSKGCWLAIKRLMKCHPLNDGGYDPVPPLSTSDRDK